MPAASPTDILPILLLTENECLKKLSSNPIQARGPGGQRVNKKATGVALTFPGSGISVACQKYRNRIENQTSALREFRRVLAAQNKQLPNLAVLQKIKPYLSNGLKVQDKNPDAALVIYAIAGTLHHFNGDHKETAKHLGVTPSALVRFIGKNKHLLEIVNQLREKNNRPKLIVK